MLTRFLSILILLPIIGASLESTAQADATSAREHFTRGTALYDLQRYIEAAHEYEAAFEIKNDAALLFNIAQAYRFATVYTKAIGAYRAYLRRVPDAGN